MAKNKAVSGFVYIWRDRKHKRYYIGSHWGTLDDGYICSSNWMYNSWKRRPEDFKRRVVATVITTRKDLLIEENRWLQMMKPEELKNRYYNHINKSYDHWSADEKRRAEVGEKIYKNYTRKEICDTINIPYGSYYYNIKSGKIQINK